MQSRHSPLLLRGEEKRYPFLLFVLTDKQNTVEFLLTFTFSSVKCRSLKNIHAKTELAEVTLLWCFKFHYLVGMTWWFKCFAAFVHASCFAFLPNQMYMITTVPQVPWHTGTGKMMCRRILQAWKYLHCGYLKTSVFFSVVEYLWSVEVWWCGENLLIPINTKGEKKWKIWEQNSV